jgi:hypothetical protein
VGWHAVNVVGAVMDEFLYAIEHPEAGEPHVQRLVDEPGITPHPGWTTKQLHHRTEKRNLPKVAAARLSVTEMDALTVRASVAGMTVSAYVRRLILADFDRAPETPRRPMRPPTAAGDADQT